jgi:hypothetical protein
MQGQPAHRGQRNGGETQLRIGVGGDRIAFGECFGDLTR